MVLQVSVRGQLAVLVLGRDQAVCHYRACEGVKTLIGAREKGRDQGPTVPREGTPSP